MSRIHKFEGIRRVKRPTNKLRGLKITISRHLSEYENRRKRVEGLKYTSMYRDSEIYRTQINNELLWCDEIIRIFHGFLGLMDNQKSSPTSGEDHESVAVRPDTGG